MKNTSAVLFGICIVSGLSASAGWAAPPPAHLIVKPADLKWEVAAGLPCGVTVATIEGPMSEALPFTVRARMPANCRIPPHWHPAIEHVTVLEGTLYMGSGDTLDESKATALPVGSVAIMQANAHHYAISKEEVVIQLHGVGPWGITYVNPADDPRNTKK